MVSWYDTMFLTSKKEKLHIFVITALYDCQALKFFSLAFSSESQDHQNKNGKNCLGNKWM